MTIEVCANSLTSALNAQKAGANRIELCQILWCGGTTPSAATVELAREMIDIDLAILIRPRSGDFCYSDIEFQTMQREILFCKEIGIDGVVVGILLPNGQIDIRRTAQLVRLAHPMDVCFHRALDFCKNPIKGVSQLKSIGVSRVLTSGSMPTAIEGIPIINQLIQQVGNTIEIMAGGGITPDNIMELLNKTSVDAIHLSGKALIKSPFQANNMQINTGKIPEFDYQETNPKTVLAITTMLQFIVI